MYRRCWLTRTLQKKQTAHDMKVRLKKRSIMEQESPTRQKHQRQENIMQNWENSTPVASLSQLQPFHAMTKSYKALLFSSPNSDLHLMGALYLPNPILCGHPQGFVNLVLDTKLALDQLQQRNLRSKSIFKS